MNHLTNFLLSATILVASCLGNTYTVKAAPADPNYGSTEWMTAVKGDPNLNTFIDSVKSGQAGVLTGIYVPGVMAYPVVQQPSNNAGFVSTVPDTLTQFGLASQYGAIGILAHNTLAGASFSNIKNESNIILVYGDGSIEQYRVNGVEEYQALSPQSPYSDFINIAAPDQKISATQLFYDVYAHEDQVVLQTCIENDGNPSWGRLFITATPFNPVSNFIRGSIVKHFRPL